MIRSITFIAVLFLVVSCKATILGNQNASLKAPARPTCVTQATQQQQTYFSILSGIVPNQLGYYDSCLNSNNSMKYMLVNYNNTLKADRIDYWWGFCVPNKCTEDELSAYGQQFTKYPYQAYARDPNDPKNQFKFGTAAWIFTIFTIVATVFSIIATVVHQLHKREERLIKERESIMMRTTLGRTMLGGTPGMMTMLEQSPVTPNSVAFGAPVPKEVLRAEKEEPLLKLKDGESAPKRKRHIDFFALFDMVSNISGLVDPRIRNSSAQVFDLLRVFAMIWVVLGHELGYRLTVSENFIDQGFLNYTKNSWYFTYNMSAFYAVDIFLFMGGYVSIISLSKFILNFSPFKIYKVPIVYLFCIFKRYMRIMPAYAFLLCYWYLVAPTIISGPLSQGTLSMYPCNWTNFWQSFILGLHSDVVHNSMCAGWCWYLAIDFKAFCTIPLILIIATFFGRKRKQAALGICIFLTAASLGYTIYVCFHHDIKYLNPWDPANTMNTYYYADVLQRSSIYYVGCIFAFMTTKDKESQKKGPGKESVVTTEKGSTVGEAAKAPAGEKSPEEIERDKEADERRKRRKLKLLRKIQLIYFAAGLAGLVFITCILHYYFQWGRRVQDLKEVWNALFITFGKFFFVLCFMTVLLMIGFRFKGFGDYIAGNRLLQLIANLSFTMYLFHFTFIMIRTYSQKSIPSISGSDLFVAGLTELTYTLVVGVFAAVVIEIPAMNLWRVYCEAVLLNKVKKI